MLRLRLLFSLAALLTSTVCIAQLNGAPAGTPDASGALSSDDGGEQVASQVRIVRLSQVRGAVQIDRANTQLESAITNMPVTTGTRLKTADGLAEVEFEDNSTLRLTPHSEVVFEQLGRSATGATITRCRLLQGTAYLHVERTRDAAFTVAIGNNQLQVNPSTHARLDMADGRPVVAVLEGSLSAQTPAGTTVITKKQTLNLADADAGTPQVANKVEKQTLDGWDKQETQYYQRYSGLVSSGGSGYLSGTSDLQYYGGFVDMPGCGSLWRPYLANAAWDPYGTGLWAWYGGAGYSWVSPYPWGWLPYHTGAWSFCPGSGWGWRPGGAWRGLNNAPRRPVATPRPQLPPGPGHPWLMVVGAHQVQRSELSTDGTFVLRNNSASLGVPRASFNNLAKLSSQVNRTGSGMMTVDAGDLGMHGFAANRPGSSSPGTLAHGGTQDRGTAASQPAHSFNSGMGAVASHSGGGATVATAGSHR